MLEIIGACRSAVLALLGSDDAHDDILRKLDDLQADAQVGDCGSVPRRPLKMLDGGRIADA